MRQAVISGVLILAAPGQPPAAWAGRSLPRDGDEWVYFGGAVEAAHIPTSQRVVSGSVSAFYQPWNYRGQGKPRSVSVGLHSMRRDARGWYKPQI